MRAKKIVQRLFSFRGSILQLIFHYFCSTKFFVKSTDSVDLYISIDKVDRYSSAMRRAIKFAFFGRPFVLRCVKSNSHFRTPCRSVSRDATESEGNVDNEPLDEPAELTSGADETGRIEGPRSVSGRAASTRQIVKMP
ncbi:unnamed protein product [Nesidiocoris tenuis]|uniref:Uncharacterized protein n=1 Tax=Nesidiocoris tenuis TaxID=355587 RepID=A0A6H5GF87_9HEMI|nr:unnamed protein product [Nesidiocoris tenuis]